MILTIKEGSWSIDTSIDEDTCTPWADLWSDRFITGFTGTDCIQRCLDSFRHIMDMDEDELIAWQMENSNR